MLFSMQEIATICPSQIPLGSPLWAFKQDSNFTGNLYILLNKVYNRFKYKAGDNTMNGSLVRSLFTYVPSTGKLFWNNPPSNSIKPGSEAGCISSRDGYVTIVVNRKRYMAHRLIWLYMMDKWPDNQIDHINHDRADNRWANLRDVTPRENHQNRPMSKANKSGVVGVSWDKQRDKWGASIKLKDKKLHLGRFDTKEEAIQARKEAEFKYGYHSNCGGPKL